MLTVGNKIKKLRELRNFTQEHMAEKLQLSISAYGKLERDETEITTSRLEQIANVLDIKMTDILAFDEKMIFNIMHNQNESVNYGYVIQNFPIELKKLYEDQIEAQKKTIAALEAQVGLMQRAR